MELSQLRYFKALAETENLTQAAKSLYISPPALSTSIARLEAEIGCPLFNRVRGRMYLSEQGRTFLANVEDSLSVLEDGMIRAREQYMRSETRLSLLVTTQTRWNRMIGDFMETYPNIRLNCRNTSLRAIDQDGAFPQVDFFLIAARPLRRSDLNMHTLFYDDTIYVRVHRHHRFVGRASLTMEDIKDESFILPPAGLGSNLLYRSFFAKRGYEPNVIAECDHFMMVHLQKRGLGISFSAVADSGDDADDSVLIPISDVKNEGYEMKSIYWNRNRHLSAAALTFRDFAFHYYHQTAEAADPAKLPPSAEEQRV